MQSFGRMEQVGARQVYSLKIAGSSPAPATNPVSGGGEQLPFLYYILYLAGGCGEYRNQCVTARGRRAQGPQVVMVGFRAVLD